MSPPIWSKLLLSPPEYLVQPFPASLVTALVVEVFTHLRNGAQPQQLLVNGYGGVQHRTRVFLRQFKVVHMGDVKDGGHLTECLLIRTVIVGSLLVVLNQHLRSPMGSYVLAANLLQVSLVDFTSGLHIRLLRLGPIIVCHSPIIEITEQLWIVAYRPPHKAVKRKPVIQIHLVNPSHNYQHFLQLPECVIPATRPSSYRRYS